ncbi:MAG: histidine triad nucleotide-binding protein [Chloroflexota bacterium]
MVAFRDLHPVTPVHILVIPRRHISSYAAASADDTTLLGHLALAAAAVAAQEGVAQSGFRVVSNSGADAGQTVNHLHLHVLGGHHVGWPPFPAG